MSYKSYKSYKGGKRTKGSFGGYKKRYNRVGKSMSYKSYKGGKRTKGYKSWLVKRFPHYGKVDMPFKVGGQDVPVVFDCDTKMDRYKGEFIWNITEMIQFTDYQKKGELGLTGLLCVWLLLIYRLLDEISVE